MTIRPKLGITLILKFIIFLIEPIFCLQYCLYISSATIIPLYFVYYIHRSVLLLYSVHYIHGYMKSLPSHDRLELPLVIYPILEKTQRWGSILLTWEKETSSAVFLKQCFGNDTPMNKVELKATKLIYVSNNQLVTNTKELNKKFLEVSQAIYKSILVVWIKIWCRRRKYYKNGYFNAFRGIMRVEVVRSFWNITEISNL